MILAIDIGNTTVTLGGVRIAPQQAYSLEFTARIDINHTWSASQYESAIEQLFEDKNLSPSDFRGVIISSVVPSVLTLLQECVRNLFGTEPLLVKMCIRDSFIDDRYSDSCIKPVFHMLDWNMNIANYALSLIHIWVAECRWHSFSNDRNEV